MNFASLLKPDYFENGSSKILFGITKEYVLSYEREIEPNQLVILTEETCRSRGYDSDTYHALKQEIKTIFKTHIKSEEFIRDQLVKFVKERAINNALGESIEILEKGDSYEKVLKLIDQAVSVGDVTDKGMSFQDLLYLPARYKEKYHEGSLIKTGFFSYDHALGGGLAPGELHVIVAPPKTGKSTMAVNVGAFVLGQGKPVFHCSLELKKMDVAIKYAARLTGLSYSEILKGDGKLYQERLKPFIDRKPDLYINYWTMGQTTALDIRSWISQIRAQNGKNPGLIIVDYDDCLKPVGGGRDNMYEDAGDIYSDLIALGDYFKCPVLTLAQPRRDAWELYNQSKPELITMGHLAHSAKKAHHCYSISSLNFKKGDDNGVLYVDVARRGESNVEIKVKREFSKGMIKQSI